MDDSTKLPYFKQAFFFCLFVILALVFTLFQFRSDKNSKLDEKDALLKQKERQIELLWKKSDSTNFVVKEINKKVIILNDSIVLLEKQMKIKKKQYEKDMGTINNNTLQQDVEYFSKRISESLGF